MKSPRQKLQIYHNAIFGLLENPVCPQARKKAREAYDMGPSMGSESPPGRQAQIRELVLKLEIEVRGLGGDVPSLIHQLKKLSI